MAPDPEDSTLPTALDKLSIKTTSKPKSGQKSKKKVVDSWEDEEDESDDATEVVTAAKPGTSAPPPTPITPNLAGVPVSSRFAGDSPSRDAEERRPEKTDAVARRMIAAGLGLKAPKQTEEQKAYQRAIREQEKKRREQEKAEEQRRQEDIQKAKAAVWDD